MHSCAYPEKPTSTTISSAPLDATHSLITVTVDEEKFPCLMLPDDMDTVTVKMVKSGLMDYMNVAWGMSLLSLPAGQLLIILEEHALPPRFWVPLPLSSLKSAPANFFSSPDQVAMFHNVQPENMSGNDTFCMLKLISDMQKHDQESPFKFSVPVDTLNSLSEDGEIEEISQPSTSLPKCQTKCSKGKSKVAPSAHPVANFTPTFFNTKMGLTVSGTDNNASISDITEEEHTSNVSNPPSLVTPVSNAIVAESLVGDDSPNSGDANSSGIMVAAMEAEKHHPTTAGILISTGLSDITIIAAKGRKCKLAVKRSQQHAAASASCKRSKQDISASVSTGDDQSSILPDEQALSSSTKLAVIILAANQCSSTRKDAY